MNFPKFAKDGWTYGRTEKKVTPKDPLRINARDLKKPGIDLLKRWLLLDIERVSEKKGIFKVYFLFFKGHKRNEFFVWLHLYVCIKQTLGA